MVCHPSKDSCCYMCIVYIRFITQSFTGQLNWYATLVVFLCDKICLTKFKHFYCFLYLFFCDLGLRSNKNKIEAFDDFRRNQNQKLKYIDILKYSTLDQNLRRVDHVQNIYPEILNFNEPVQHLSAEYRQGWDT